jgi:drug/metabolite transporter (DMT)-like permease
MNFSVAARGRRDILVTAALFSTGGVAIKSIQMAGIQISCLRSGIAAAALLLFLPGARRGWTRSVWLLALAYAGTLASFVMANKLTTSANAIFLQNTTPIYILVLGAVFLKEYPRRSDFVFLTPVAAGLLMCFFAEQRALATAPNPRLGNLFALASGLLYAVVITGFRWQARSGVQSAGVKTATVGNILACLLALPFALPFAAGRPLDWAILAYLGIFQIGFAYFLMTRAIGHVSAFETSLLLLLEPTLNPIWTWLVYRERPGDLAIAGGILILISTTIWTWWNTRRPAGSTITA